MRRDGGNATHTIVRLVSESRFNEHLHAVLLQGIIFAGLIVVDQRVAYDALQIPVIPIISRRQPDTDAVRIAFLGALPRRTAQMAADRKGRSPEPAAGVALYAGILPNSVPISCA